MTTESKIVEGKAKPRGRFPHVKRAGDYLVRFWNKLAPRGRYHRGCGRGFAGAPQLDIRAQTRAVIENIRDILASMDARNCGRGGSFCLPREHGRFCGLQRGLCGIFR